MAATATGEEGDFFFLDENGVPTTVVSGDASKMTVVAYLEGDKTYDSAFITANATEKDLETLETLAAGSAPTSDKGSGGCDAGLGGLALLAVVGLIARKRK